MRQDIGPSMHMYARPLTGLCSAHQDIIPVLVAPLGKAGIEARQVDAMARAQGIEYIIWQAALVVEDEVAFQDGRGIHKPGGQATCLALCLAELPHGVHGPNTSRMFFFLLRLKFPLRLSFGTYHTTGRSPLRGVASITIPTTI